MYFPTVLLSIPNSLAIWLLFILIDVPSISGFNLYKSFTDSIFISVITSLLIINEVLLLLHDNSFVHFYLAHFVHLLLSLNTWGKYQVPFVFATNGRQYIKQYEIKSGVWFDDLRKPSESPKAMFGWMHPEGLQKLLKENTGALPKLKELGDEDLRDSKGLNMRDYQIEAIHAVNNAIDDGQKHILVATATDTGKTRTFLALIYSFLKSNRFKRILVLVDRNSLGTQAIKCRL